MANPLPSVEDIKRRFVANGETVVDWAKSHGFPQDAVYAVLSGRTRGRRGKSHKIAVALGIKSQPSAPDKSASVEIGASPQ